MGEPGGLPSMGSHRVGHDWSDLVVVVVVVVVVGHHGAPNWAPHAIQHVLPPIYFTHSSAQISIPNSYFIPHYLSPTHIHTSILYMSGSSCPKNRFTCAISLSSTYMQWYIFVFLFMTYFILCNSLLGPSMSLPMTQCRSLLWLNNILLYICTTSSLFIPLFLGI